MLTLTDANATLKDNEYLVVDKSSKMGVVFDLTALERHGEERMKKLYQVADDGSLTEVDLERSIETLINEISNFFARLPWTPNPGKDAHDSFTAPTLASTPDSTCVQGLPCQ